MTNSLETLKIAFNSIPFGLVLTDENYHILLINTPGMKTLGYSGIGELNGKALRHLFQNQNIPVLSESEQDFIRQDLIISKSDGALMPVFTALTKLTIEERELFLLSFTDITKRVKATAELEEQQRTLQSLLSTLPGMVYRCNNDQDWTMLFLPEGCYELTGYTREELTNNSMVSYGSLIHPEDRHMVWETVQQGVEADRHYNIDYRIINRTGAIRWVSERGHGVKGENGELRFLEGFIIDITEQKNDEKLQKTLYEISKAAYLSTSLDEFYLNVHLHLGQVIDANNFYVAKYDKETDTISLPYHVDFKDNFKSFPAGKTITGYVIRTKQAILANEEIITELNQKGEIDIIGTPAKVWLGVPLIVAGDVTGVLAVQSYTDPQQYTQRELELLKFIADQVAIFITRKTAEESGLRESAYLNQLFEGSPEAIIMIDNDHRVVRANRVFQELFGYSQEEAFGRDIDTLIASPEIFNEARGISEKVKQGETYEMETRRKHKNGHLVDVSVLVTPIVISGQVIGGYGIYRDITEKKRTEKNLIEAKEKAEESDKLKSAFLSNMSHEIRTPMNAILGFSTLLSDSEITESDRKEFIQIIRDRGNDLMRIIDDIIDVAKIESGQIKVEIRECQVNKLLENLHITLNEVRKKQLKDHIDLRFKPGTNDGEFSILTDGNRLRQVLTNLIENALKFTDDGFVEFGYLFKESDTQEPVIEFYVTDSGIGIPEESQTLIFERFRQVDDTHTRKYGGTGLGLTIVKNLVQLLGGEIKVRSSYHHGTTFYVDLPLQTGLTYTREIKAAEPVSASKKEIANKHILIAEDEESNFYLLDRILKRAGITTSWARNGLEAIDMCRKNKYDLILMDIRMPVLDGYEATQEIKKFAPNLPVIAQTAYALKGEKEKSLAAGCDAYVSKPIDAGELLAILNRLLKI